MRLKLRNINHFRNIGKICTRLLFLFSLLQLALIFGWLLISPLEKQIEKRLVEIYRTTLKTDYEIKKMNEEVSVHDLAIHVKNSSGRNLRIDFVETKTGKLVKIDVAFNYAKPNVPKTVEFSTLGAKSRADPNPTKYVQVYNKYWEQMTMNIRSMIALCGQAKIGGRRVVQPMVKDSSFGPKGHSLGLYFNLTHMTSILKASEYSTLIGQEDYDTDCSALNSSHVTVHFLYDAENAVWFTKNKFRLSDEQYKKISKNAEGKGWTECSFIRKVIRQSPRSKYFCVDPTVLTEWRVLERDVVRGAKCLTIVMWRGIGSSYRTHFSEKFLKRTSRDIQFALKPTTNIQNEVERFKKAFLPGRYIAVHVRGERVVIPHNLDRLRKCIGLLIDVIQIIKKSSHITQVLVATDMSSFGSGSWTGSLKGETTDVNSLKNFHDRLISSVGGIVYKPNAGHVDRGVVALIEMTLISQAQHLVVTGGGSFQEWIEAKFLEYTRDYPRNSWSLITMCTK